MSLWPNSTAVNGTRPAHSGAPRSTSASGVEHYTLNRRGRRHDGQAAGQAGGSSRIAQAQNNFGTQAALAIDDHRSRVDHRMPRAAQRYVMHYPPNAGVGGAVAQHVHRLGTQKRHAGDIRLGVDAGLTKVRLQVRTHPGQCLGHSAPDGGGTVKFTPESASNTASFDVSKANSSVLPLVAFDAAGTLATNSCSTAPDSASSSESSDS